MIGLEEMLNQINRISIEINRIKEVILAIWDNEPHIDAQKIIEKFREDIDNIKRGD